MVDRDKIQFDLIKLVSGERTRTSCEAAGRGCNGNSSGDILGPKACNIAAWLERA